MRKEKGLTLLEVLISMLVLALGILGLAPMIVLSIEGNNISHDVLAVSTLAKERMEFLESLDSLPAVPYVMTEQSVHGGYNCTTRIWDNASDTTLPPGVYQIEILVTWTDKVGVSRATTYTTLMNKG